MSEPSFKEGDVVRLRSGGPKMTVQTYHGEGDIDVVWFDDKHQQKSGNFAATLLEKVNDRLSV